MKRYIRSDITNIEDESFEVKRSIASNPNTRPTILLKLANDPNINIRYTVAKNPNISEAVMFALISNEPSAESYDDRYVYSEIGDVLTERSDLSDNISELLAKKFPRKLAKNPNISRRAFEILAQDTSYFVALKLAENPAVPQDILLSYIVNMQSAYDRMKIYPLVANRDDLSQELMEVLINSDIPEVRFNIVHNLSTPPEILVKLIDEQHYRDALNSINMPAEVLERYSTDPNKESRFLVTQNSSTPTEVLRDMMTNDPERGIRMAAERALIRRGVLQ